MSTEKSLEQALWSLVKKKKKFSIDILGHIRIVPLFKFDIYIKYFGMFATVWQLCDLDNSSVEHTHLSQKL